MLCVLPFRVGPLLPDDWMYTYRHTDVRRGVHFTYVSRFFQETKSSDGFKAHLFAVASPIGWFISYVNTSVSWFKKDAELQQYIFFCVNRIFSLKCRKIYIDVRNLLKLNKKSIPTIRNIHFCRLMSSWDEHGFFWGLHCICECDGAELVWGVVLCIWTRAQRSVYVLLVLRLKNSTFCPQNIYLFCMYLGKKTSEFFLYSTQRMVLITEETSIYCAVRTGSLNKIH